MTILRGEGIESAAVTDGPLRAADAEMRKVTRLHKIGGKLAVYGVVETGTSEQLALWHVVNPGTYTVPQVAAHPGFGNWGLSHGRSLCGIIVVTNGHASDHTPPEISLCPACAERL